MNRNEITQALNKGLIEWQRHALERMMERDIPRDTVKEVLRSGEIIEFYSDDKPYPSALFMGWINGEPLHVVGAFDPLSGWCFVITAYRPSLNYFEEDFRTRRQK